MLGMQPSTNLAQGEGRPDLQSLQVLWILNTISYVIEIFQIVIPAKFHHKFSAVL